jgi:hypothetical protein
MVESKTGLNAAAERRRNTGENPVSAASGRR